MRMQRFYRALRNPVEFDSCRQYPAPSFRGPRMVQPSDQPQSTQSAQSFFGLTERVIGAAIEVHRHLGPGLLESTYEACLAHELAEAGIVIQRQKPLPVLYKGIRLDIGYRIDLVVEDRLIVELKS